MTFRPATSSRRSRLAAAGLAATVLAGLTGYGAHAAPDPVLDVPAVLETAPSEIADGDSMDDPAVWVDPADPSRSVILGADHADDSLNVYDLTGQRLQRLQLTSANNVDVRPGFSLGGETVPLVALAGAGEFAFFKLDPATRKISNVTAGGASVEQPRATGVCLYRSPVSSLYYVFVTGSTTINQYLLDGQTGSVSPHLVRTIDIQARTSDGKDAPLEACAADDRGRSLFAGESDWSLWRYGAEPGDPAGTSDRVEVDKTYEFGGHFEADIEGHTVLNLPNGEGFLIASSQGDATFNVFRSTAPYEFIRKFRVVASATADGCNRTDGIEAVAGNFGPEFPYGFFVCQDNANTAPHPGNMNMKLVRLEQILPEVMTATAPTTTTTQPPPQPQPQPQPAPPTLAAAQPTAARSGYWMLGAKGKVFAFGDARAHGEPVVKAPATAVDLEPTPSGDGYWVLDDRGGVTAHGDATHHGVSTAAQLRAGEKVTSLSATRSGQGYWVFTTLGRVFPFGDAEHLGDMAGTHLNGPVLDSVVTPSGRGYYTVASDGGIFSFGDAEFLGSMGDTRLNAPVQSLVPDPDGRGYWLVAADGGVFAFAAPFEGAMGGTPLNQPVTGMVQYGNGYLMVAADGGIFNFSDKPFAGSLGADPPADPITAVAALG